MAWRFLAKEKGFEVFLSDFGSLHDAHRETLQLHGIDFGGRHTEARILQAVEVVKSPGFPIRHPSFVPFGSVAYR